MIQEWWTASELAAAKLTGLPGTKSGVIRFAERAEWRERRGPDGAPLARKRQGRGGGWKYHVTLLPASAVLDLTRRAGRTAAAAEEPKTEAVRSASWEAFERLPDKRKRIARERAEILDAVMLAEVRLGRRAAVGAIADQRNLSGSTIWNWLRLVAGLPRCDWLPALAPKYKGCTATAECSPEAWEFIKTDYLRRERPSFASCYARLERVAAEKGWTIPAARTLRRRIKALPAAMVTLAREGEQALKRMYPAQRRDRTGLHACEWYVSDGHLWDLVVRWPDGRIDRPLMLAVSDLYSGKILAWRIDRTENADLVRLAFHDAFRDFGIPDKFLLDNGRAFAAKSVSGGVPSRFRWKWRPEEPEGVLKALGIEVHWTLPYSGQSKPIERSFRDFCDHIAKHPAFTGAYLGSSPETRPEGGGERPVPMETFLATLRKEIAAWNAKPKRRTAVCGGTLSFDEAFRRSYEQAPIRRATEEQLRLCMLASEPVTARKPDGHLEFAGNAYWAEFLGEWIGRKLTIRFDPEGDLHAPVAVYRPDGVLLGEAQCIASSGFGDAAAARAHARERRRVAKQTRRLLEAERRLDAAEVAATLAGLPDPESTVPARKVVRGAFETPKAPKAPAAQPPGQTAEVFDWEAHRRGLERELERRRQEMGGTGA